MLKLAELRSRLAGDSTDTAARAHRMLLAMDISRFLDRSYDPAGRPAASAPEPTGQPDRRRAAV